MRALCGAIGVFVFGVAVYAGLEGTEAPDRNASLTIIYVTAWLGFPIFSIFLGNVFSAFNPWKAVSSVVGRTFRLASPEGPAHLRYPEKLGRWPAAVGLVAFVWLELVFSQGSDVSAGVVPHDLGVAGIAYSVYTFAMVGIFGREAWFKYGEIFSVYFGMFGSLGKFEVREGVLGVRRFLAGSTSWVSGGRTGAASIAGSVAVVIASIGTTTFDGAQEGVFKGGVEWVFDRMIDIGASPTVALRTSGTVFMLISITIVTLIYFLGVRGMSTVPGGPDRTALWRGFGHVLIPIAFAYLLAHYFSLIYYQEQAQFTYLLSDPLGTGTTDLFGTAGSGVDYTGLSNQLIWYIQVAALVGGHVAGLVLAHDRAISYWGDYRLAARSQYWMLAVMVAFTCFGLFLLSVSNV